MDLPISLQDITYAENYLAQGDLATATPLLERLVELAEEYIDAECKTEEKRQYFSFDSKFERLAYRRVEKDPRELVQVEVPFDRLYSDMAFAYIRQQDYVSARNALMQAVRWDPMNCNYRLDLAELFRALEDKQEWASLSFSVLERASDGKCAARAYANLGQYFLEPETENVSAAVGCARLALRLAPNDVHTTRLLNKIHTAYPDAADESDDHVMGELSLQGVPTSPSAEIAICLIMCATDAASDGDKQEATRLTVRARDLVGEEACASARQSVTPRAQTSMEPRRSAMPSKRERKLISKNRSAHHEYFIDETFECGIELSGTEVKSIRERACQITDTFALIRGGECWLVGLHIHPYSHGGVWNRDPDRRRRLLLHRKEIDFLDGKLRNRGYALVPLELYFNTDGRVKLLLGLGRGKKLYDKREDMAKRDVQREIDRALKERNR